MEKKYYKSLDELNQKPEESKNSKPEGFLGMLDKESTELSSNRRDFLKLFGFSIASSAVLASCEQPVRKAIPYLIKPDEVTPGKANYYASTYAEGSYYCPVLVKVRDGRPIKIEGNTLSSVTKGGTSARAQASVLNLYDVTRYQQPSIDKQNTTWEAVDSKITESLKIIKDKNGKVVVLSSSIYSPSTQEAINKFIAAYPGSEHVQYDAISASAILEANDAMFGKKIIPTYDFSKAKVIVSFNADFLGSWLSPIEFTKQYAGNRKLTEGQKTLSKHYQLEAGMSLTGSNADERIIIKSSQEKAVLAALFSEVSGAGHGSDLGVDISGIVKDLKSHKGDSLVVSGSNDIECQALVNAINHELGNYSTTINLNKAFQLKQGIDADFEKLVQELNEGKVAALVCLDANPVYDSPLSTEFKAGLEKTELSVSLANRKDETAELVQLVAPNHHYLESWNDAEPAEGIYSLSQPAIRPIFNTRSAIESLLAWSGNTVDESLSFVKEYWLKNIFPRANKLSFEAFWTQTVHDGVFELNTSNPTSPSINSQIVNTALNHKNEASSTIEISFYENVSVGDGKNANNAWLQELPDPVSKVTWDNYAAVSPTYASSEGLEDGSLIK
jgi:MoCo/4Fe-4S cofactor protein with predicted Tat translocation signal